MSERSASEWTRLLVEGWERGSRDLLQVAVEIEEADDAGRLEAVLQQEATMQVELTVRLLLDRYLPVKEEYVTGRGGLLLLCGLVGEELPRAYEAAGAVLAG